MELTIMRLLSRTKNANNNNNNNNNLSIKKMHLYVLISQF